MTTWFTSDTHFGHKNVIEYCKRPFKSVFEMNTQLVVNWNCLVRPEDIIYCLGDMSFSKASVGCALMKSLNGTKILIQGNHDKYSVTQYREAGFSAVLREATIKLQGQKFRLSHYPYAPDSTEVDPSMVRYMDRRPERKTNEWLLHGHVHCAWKQKDTQINVGVDVWNYGPVHENEILKLTTAKAGN